MNSGGVDITFFLMMGAIFAIFYLLVIRPQQKQQREREAFLQTAARGDDVVTQGGIHGRVSAVENDVLEIEVARVRGEKVKLRISVSKVDQLTKAGGKASSDGNDTKGNTKANTKGSTKASTKGNTKGKGDES
jgi:preprotein translocase subunit YajC